MALEKEGYREQLARLSEKFPAKEAISIKESCCLLGCHRETIMNDKTFPKKKLGGRYIVPIPALARWLA